MTDTTAFSNQKLLCDQTEISYIRPQRKSTLKWYKLTDNLDFFTKLSASGFEVFSVTGRKNVMEFENLSKTISAS